MTYVTLFQSPSYRQMSIEEFLFSESPEPVTISQGFTNTRTFVTSNINDVVKKGLFPSAFDLIVALQSFNDRHRRLISEENKLTLYSTFYIPKKSGGLRRIDAPNDSLMRALRELKEIFERDFKALYHTNAFAYIKNRSVVDSIKRHQQNESKWFAKFDLSDFFGSTTMEFVMSMLGKIFPFSDVVSVESGRRALREALSLGFLNGGLPQGTPLSPLLTNVIMIPIDHEISRGLRNLDTNKYVYTRYADDFIVSSRYTFSLNKVQDMILGILREKGAPFRINTSKTRYGSSAGRNFNLGLMLNKDNEITVGHKKKRVFKAMITSFILDTRSGNKWPLDDVQRLAGYRNYYRMVEKETIDAMIGHIERKYDADVNRMLKEELQ